MAIEGKDRDDKWHLGAVEPHEDHPHERETPPAPPVAEPEPDPSARILERPLYVLTVEHLAYFLIAAWTIATRLVALGIRPLTPAEATHALFDLKLARDGAALSHQLSAPYPIAMHIVEAWLFGGLGADDCVARLGFALGGILMVAIAFGLRRPLGRVGALALAVMIAISPSMTYFSRSGVSPIPALAMTLAAIALFFAMAKRFTFIRAAAAATAAALALACDPTSYVTAAIFVVAAFASALWSGMFDDTYFERVRYWWVRNGIKAAAALAIGVVVWTLLEGGSWRYHIAVAMTPNDTAIASGAGVPGYRHGIDFYLPIFALYEFLPLILAIAGSILFVFYQLRSRFAGWCFIWAVASIAFYLYAPARRAELAPVTLVPMAIMGAIAIDYGARRSGWRIVQYPLIVLAVLTIYVALTVNFCRDVPDASEATWARHMLLYWSDPATTAQAREESTHLRGTVARSAGGQTGGIFFSGDAPALRWYLRDIPTAAQAEAAAATVVAIGHANRPSPEAQTTTFDLQQRWNPELRGASAREILRYVLTQRAWSAVTTDEAGIVLPAVAATPSPLASPIATASSTPTPSQTPTATPVASPSPSTQHQAAPAESPSQALASVTASPEASLTPSPTTTPSSSSSATPSATSTPIGIAAASATSSPTPAATPSVAASATAVAATPTPSATESSQASPTSSISVTPAAIPTPIKFEN
ncbi:MAG: hypothetical protein ABSD31_16350 [Candidatus Binataceae bacterium]|jgi:uncharacterized protein (TIGR03663 family)